MPLSITDVLLSLQMGMVNTAYGLTQGALALQCFTKVKHVTRRRMGYPTGGVLISKKKFDKRVLELEKNWQENTSPQNSSMNCLST
jgi:TRAP-type transport system periplasmic protein